MQKNDDPTFTLPAALNWVMQLLLGPTKGIGPSKNDIDDAPSSSPWANLLSVGIRILTAILGGPQPQSDGIDKVDNQASSPMQVPNFP